MRAYQYVVKLDDRGRYVEWQDGLYKQVKPAVEDYGPRRELRTEGFDPAEYNRPVQVDDLVICAQCTAEYADVVKAIMEEIGN